MQFIKPLRKAFTLVELLIVVAIMAILVSVLVLVLDPIRLQNRSRDSVLQETLADIANVLQAYHNLKNAYPSSAAEIQTYFTDSITVAEESGNLTFTKVGTVAGSGTITFYPAVVCLSAVSNVDAAMNYEWQPGNTVELVSSDASCAP